MINGTRGASNVGDDRAQLLSGISVVEESRGVGAAYCGRILADLGATVHRIRGPLTIDLASAHREALVRSLNNGKHQVERPPGGGGPWDALATADVLVSDDTATSGTLLAELVAQHPQLVTVSVSPYGRTGRWRDRPGTGLTATAVSGISMAIGDKDGPPLTLPFDLADYEAGVNAAGAAIAGLLARQRLGRAPVVDVAVADVLTYYAGMNTGMYTHYDRPWRREGRRAAGSAGPYPYALFPCSDGLIAICGRSQGDWDALVLAMGSPQWASDDRFRDPWVISRLHADEADVQLTAWTSQQSRANILAAGREFGFPVGPVNTMREALQEPQFAARRFLIPDVDGAVLPGPPFALVRPASDEDRTSDPSSASTAPSAPARRTSTARSVDASAILKGIRVVDLSWVWSGPAVGTALADLGAEVIKVESRQRPDGSRLRGRPLRDGVPVPGPALELPPYFHQVNHGKRSVGVDLRTDEGVEVVRELIARSDVVIENMRPGVLTRLGLDPLQLISSTPNLVVVSLSTAGAHGPLKDLKGYAPVMSALAGLESLVGYGPDHVTGMLSHAIGDPNAAAHALPVVLAALLGRERSDRGVWVDLSQIEAMLAVLRGPLAQAARGDEVVPPANRHSEFAPHGHFPCAGPDQWVALAVRSDDEWKALCQCAPDTPFAGDPELLTSVGRLRNQSRLETQLATWTSSWRRDELVEELVLHGVAASPVLTFEEAAQHAHFAERRVSRQIHHPFMGVEQIFHLPWHLDDAVPGTGRRAPLLGEDTIAVLSDILSFPAEEVNRLAASGVIELPEALPANPRGGGVRGDAAAVTS